MEYNHIKKLNALHKSNKRSYKLAIAAFCQQCMGCTTEHLQPGTSGDIRNCTAPDCPLFEYRPYQHSGKQPAESKQAA